MSQESLSADWLLPPQIIISHFLRTQVKPNMLKYINSHLACSRNEGWPQHLRLRYQFHLAPLQSVDKIGTSIKCYVICRAHTAGLSTWGYNLCCKLRLEELNEFTIKPFLSLVFYAQDWRRDKSSLKQRSLLLQVLPELHQLSSAVDC